MRPLPAITLLFTLSLAATLSVADCIQGNCVNGQGTYTWSDGEQYIGEWKDNKKNGLGTYTFADGDKYVGEWKDDKKNGQGTYTYANGRKYVGEWKDDKKDGQGTYTSSDGDQYVGEFEDNLLNGKGILTFADGSVESGLWENGGLVMTQAQLDAEEAAAEKYKRIYNACLLDRALTVDMSVASIETAVKETCAAITKETLLP